MNRSPRIDEDRQFQTWLNERKMLFDRIGIYLVAISFLALAYVASLNLHSKFSLIISGFGFVVGIVIGIDMVPNARRIAGLTKKYHREAQLGEKRGGTLLALFAAISSVVTVLFWVGLSVGALFWHII